MTSALPRTVGHALRHSNSLGTRGCAAPSPALQPAPGLQPGSWRARHGNHLSVRTSTCSSTSSPVEALGSLSRLGRKSKDRLRSTDNGRGARLQCMAAPGSPSGAPLSKSLEGVTIYKSDGTPVPVLSLWKDKKAVVAWVRHYGCLLCRKRAASLAEMKDALDAAGVTLAVIGPASVDQALAFLEQTKFPGEVYADPEHASFEALQFVSGVGTILNAKAGMNLVKARLQGFTQDWNLSLRQDTVARGGWQQGGVLVAGPGVDNVIFLHKDQEAGDEPDMERVKEACCGTPASA